MNLTTDNRIPSLDGLRTIAVALVVISHFLPGIGIYNTMNVGMLGVRFFFVISGFLITGLLLKEIDRTESVNLSKFYFRRTLRIFPPYYFYLLVMFVAARFEIVPPNGSLMPSLTYTSNYFVATGWNVLHTWSLSVEEQFYLIFPFILLLFGSRKIAWLLVALIFAAPFLRLIDFQLFNATHPMWANYGFHANMDGLATGCLLAVLYERLHKLASYRKLLASKLFVLVPVAVLIVNSTISPVWFYLGVSFSVTNILAALCIDWAITNYRENFVGRLLNTRPMEKIGVMSYSIYLWQQPFMNHDSVSWFNAFPYNFLGIAAFSAFSYYVIERYSLRWRGAIENRLFGQKVIAPPVAAEITIG